MSSGSNPFAAVLLCLAQAAFATSARGGEAETACGRLGADHVYDVERWPEGSIRTERCLLDGVPDGPFRELSRGGRPLAEGQYREGVEAGQWTRWHPGGERESTGSYEDGRESGPWRYWHPSGRVRAEGSYRCGARVGEWRISSAAGKETRRTSPAGGGCRPVRPAYVHASVGYTSLFYRETGHPDLNMIALSLKVGYQRPVFSGDWEFGASAFVTALPLGDSNPSSDARFLGLNARLGWVAPSVASPWRLSLMGGLYYTTMIVSGDPFGFSNMFGPQFFPVLRRETGEGESIGVYLKYSLMMDGLSFFGFPNREVAGGVSYEFLLPNRHPLSVSLDLANFRLDFEGSHLKASSVTLGAGYGF